MDWTSGQRRDLEQSDENQYYFEPQKGKEKEQDIFCACVREFIMTCTIVIVDNNNIRQSV